MDRRELGQMGETIAAELLKRKGYRIIRRNYRNKAGEIDIIAGKGSAIHFVEVKTRQNHHYGRPCEAVTEEKKQHIRKAAYLYLNEVKSRGYVPGRTSFDIMEITVEHLEAAF
ncbi:MAG: YraN family protein [Bacillota bacterium]|nr:YraN family protein [Bacillota bacterium]